MPRVWHRVGRARSKKGLLDAFLDAGLGYLEVKCEAGALRGVDAEGVARSQVMVHYPARERWCSPDVGGSGVVEAARALYDQNVAWVDHEALKKPPASAALVHPCVGCGKEVAMADIRWGRGQDKTERHPRQCASGPNRCAEVPLVAGAPPVSCVDCADAFWVEQGRAAWGLQCATCRKLRIPKLASAKKTDPKRKRGGA